MNGPMENAKQVMFIFPTAFRFLNLIPKFQEYINYQFQIFSDETIKLTVMIR